MITEKTANKIMGHYCTLATFGAYTPENHVQILDNIERLLAMKVRGKVLLSNLRDYCLEMGLRFGLVTKFTKTGEYFKPELCEELNN